MVQPGGFRPRVISSAAVESSSGKSCRNGAGLSCHVQLYLLPACFVTGNPVPIFSDTPVQRSRHFFYRSAQTLSRGSVSLSLPVVRFMAIESRLPPVPRPDASPVGKLVQRHELPSSKRPQRWQAAARSGQPDRYQNHCPWRSARRTVPFRKDTSAP